MELEENKISYAIRGATYRIFNELGPGLLESVYEEILAFELKEAGHDVQRQKPLPVEYKGRKMDLGYRLDLLINGLVPIEVKSVENLAEVHHKQLLTYMRIGGYRLGILINFNVVTIEQGIFRKVNKFPELK